MTTLSILIVDDETDNFDVIEALLDGQNYQLHYAATGYQALESLNSIRPDLILLDVMMPGIDGIEVCRQIKTHPQWKIIPIIMITALSAKADLANCIEAGADDFVSKPVTAVELRARVHSMLRIKQQYDQLQALHQTQSNTIHLLETTLDALHGNLASTLGHELNTPLNGILGTISLLRLSLDSMSTEEVREMLGWVDQSAQRLEHLTQKFRVYLELELIASQQQPLQSSLTPFPRETLTEQLLAKAIQAERKDDIVLLFEDSKITLPERYLVIIFNELLDNALKFSAPTTMIKVEGRVKGHQLCGSVHNLGRGMTEEQIDKIGALMQFDRHVYEQQGIGMGLKIVRRIIELAGGQLSITGQYQKDITVQFTLPLAMD
ncbi:MAG: response regulator [Cyanothece sp. SIO2G6]|nr:response regulator [Cyanothece sp. SIO2G6]